MTKVDLAKLISPLFWVSRPLGVLPISHRDGRFVVDRALFAYSVGVRLFSSLVGTSYYLNMLWLASRQENVGEKILDLFVNGIMYAIAVLSVHFAYKCSTLLVEVLENIADVLRRIDFVDANQSLKHIRIFTIIVQVMTIVYLTIYEFRASLSPPAVLTVVKLCELLSRVGCVGSVTAIGTVFCVLVLVLKGVARALNEEVAAWATAIGVRGEKHHLQRQFSRRLVALRHCYGKVHDVCAQLNRIFGIFVLMSLTYHGSYLQLELFDTVRNSYKSLVYDAVFDEGKLEYYHWLFVDAGKAASYFIAVGLFAAEYRKIKKILCAFVNSLPASKLRESVHCFSLEISTLNVDLTASGFFVIGWDVLFASAASCAVNVAILFQAYIANLEQNKVSLHQTVLTRPN
ncbi:Hypothetical predicted protein [Cloeon dipterum]|uniref:Gustatory receptor n=1 Tax=Cloeon dipterum TaxID=197152 RepID=A0A8S1CQR1_9INSE|nr:Hypothetical predicted protein [Cloeon dipterum]